MRTHILACVAVFFCLTVLVNGQNKICDAPGGLFFYNGQGITFVSFDNGKQTLVEPCPPEAEFSASADGRVLTAYYVIKSRQEGTNVFRESAMGRKDLITGQTGLIMFRGGPFGVQVQSLIGVLRASNAKNLLLSPDGKLLVFYTDRLNLQTRMSYPSISVLDISASDGVAKELLRLPPEFQEMGKTIPAIWPLTSSSFTAKPGVKPICYAFPHLQRWMQGEKILAVAHSDKTEKCVGITIFDLDAERRKRLGICNLTFSTRLQVDCRGITFAPDGSLDIHGSGQSFNIPQKIIGDIIKTFTTGRVPIINKSLDQNKIEILPVSLSGSGICCIDKNVYAMLDRSSGSVVVRENEKETKIASASEQSSSLSYCVVNPFAPIVAGKTGRPVR